MKSSVTLCVARLTADIMILPFALLILAFTNVVARAPEMIYNQPAYEGRDAFERLAFAANGIELGV